ncbi:MAG: hypothetical protein H8E27_05165 [Verrucomicrobia subdivision 3 bacterium]|nr:hypothetical protein [Limisphaerales bacterium]
MRNEAAGFTGDSVESVSAAINRYAGQNGMEPVSVSICQEGAGSSAYFRGIAVFTPQYEEEEDGAEEAGY